MTVESVPATRATTGIGAMAVLRRGLAESPSLRRGFAYVGAFAVAGAAGRLLVPVLLQQVIDRGLSGGALRPEIVYPMCAVAATAVTLVYLAARFAFGRMVSASETALRDLRVRTFRHIHDLSIAVQGEERRGGLVSRVTTDVDTLAEFLDWGGLQWVTSSVLMLGCAGLMFAYSWRLTLAVLLVVFPVGLVLRYVQRSLSGAFDDVRRSVGDVLAEVSEAVTGAATLRAYSATGTAAARLRAAIDRRYRAQLRANIFTATIFPVADLFGALGLATVVVLGATEGPAWGLSLGDVVAFLFLTTQLLLPMAELSESFQYAQTAVAGWRRVLEIADLPVEIVEPAPGLPLPRGALGLRVERASYSYLPGRPVLADIDVDLPPGTHAAVVGQTGSGKTTFARLVVRLADPDQGRIVVGGVDLREVAPEARRRAVRMVPQDGFLFDTSLADNIRMGRPGADDAEVRAALADLGLLDWSQSLPHGLDTRAGERGGELSVGERQLVALARAQIGDAGLLVLDEATSSVDPATERRLSDALARLAHGRTTVTIAHRLSTAEAADVVLVFDRGRIVERGTHADLVAAGGVYARLHRSWLGNTRDVQG